MVVILIDHPKTLENSPETAEGKASVVDLHTTRAPAHVPSVLRQPSTRINDEPTHAITDWNAVAHDAADAVLKREREKTARRSFDHGFAPPKAPAKPGVFGSQLENQRAGRVEEGERFWATDNCYYDFARGAPPTHSAGEFHLLTPTCKPSPTGGGDSMFEDLTPDYLRKPPPESPSK